MRFPCRPCSDQPPRDHEPTVRTAQNDEDFIRALRLVYRAYIRSGFIDPTPYQMRVTPYHLLPTTQVLVSVLRGEVISTTTLIGDGELGLPMEDLYAAEVDVRRQKGIRLAEVSCLADRRADFERAFGMLVQLMSLTAQTAVRLQIDQLLIAVHPRHGAFYERFFGFEVIGAMKSYEAVNNKPAVALALDLMGIAESCPRGYERLFGTPFSDEVLAPAGPSAELHRYLAWVVDRLYPAKRGRMADGAQRLEKAG